MLANSYNVPILNHKSKSSVGGYLLSYNPNFLNTSALIIETGCAIGQLKNIIFLKSESFSGYFLKETIFLIVSSNISI